jgi:hypothetical protein
VALVRAAWALVCAPIIVGDLVRRDFYRRVGLDELITPARDS